MTDCRRVYLRLPLKRLPADARCSLFHRRPQVCRKHREILGPAITWDVVTLINMSGNVPGRADDKSQRTQSR